MLTEKISRTPRFFPPDSDIECDVLVVGATLCGLLTARRLSAMGKKVCIAESDRVCPLTAAEHMGIIMSDGAMTYDRAASGFGQKADLWHDAARSGFESLVGIAQELGCKSLEQKNTLLFTDGRDTDKVQREYRLRNFSGTDTACMTEETAKDIFSFDLTAGVYSRADAAVLDISDLAGTLADQLSLSGAMIHEDTTVESISTGSGRMFRFSCLTDGKKTIFCNTVMDCRKYADKGFYVSKGLPLNRSTLFILRTEPIKKLRGWYEGCVIRDLYRSPMTFCVNADGSVSAFWDRGATGSFAQKYSLSYLEQVLRAMFFCTDGIVVSEKSFIPYAKRGGLPVIGRDSSMQGFFYAYCGTESNAVCSEICARALVSMTEGDKEENIPFSR